jgi:hypothetical protein
VCCTPARSWPRLWLRFLSPAPLVLRPAVPAGLPDLGAGPAGAGAVGPPAAGGAAPATGRRW